MKITIEFDEKDKEPIVYDGVTEFCCFGIKENGPNFADFRSVEGTYTRLIGLSYSHLKYLEKEAFSKEQ